MVLHLVVSLVEAEAAAVPQEYLTLMKVDILLSLVAEAVAVVVHYLAADFQEILLMILLVLRSL